MCLLREHAIINILTVSIKVGHDVKTSRFISRKEAKRRTRTAGIQTIKRPKKRNRMCAVHPRKLQLYHAPNGRAPYTEWLESQDRTTRNKIQTRIDRIGFAGNLGDYRSVGDGVFELRFRFGPGYRVYFGQIGNTIVLLLCGGDKSSQTRDIKQAKAYWQEYKES